MIALTLSALLFALSGCATRGTVRELEESVTESERERDELLDEISRLERDLTTLEQSTSRLRAERDDAVARIDDLESELAEIEKEFERAARGFGALGIPMPEALGTIDRLASAADRIRPEQPSLRPAAPHTTFDRPPQPSEPRPALRAPDDPPEPVKEVMKPPPSAPPVREVPIHGGRHEPRIAPPHLRTERVLPARPPVHPETPLERRTIAESLNGRLRIYDDRRNPWSGDTFYPYVEESPASVKAPDAREVGRRALFLALDISRTIDQLPFDMRVVQLRVGDSLRRFVIDDDAVRRIEDRSQRREILRIPATESVLDIIDSVLRGEHTTLTVEGSFERKELRIAASERRAIEAMLALSDEGARP